MSHPREELSEIMEGFPRPHSPGGYLLLNEYLTQARILSSAYNLSELYYRSLHKWMTYPLIFITVTTTVLSGFDLNRYAVCGLSFAALILSSFNSVINPTEKEHVAHSVANEYDEVACEIYQYITENGKTREEIKTYSNHINSVLCIWKGQSPPIKPRFMIRARLAHMKSKKSKSRRSESPV